MKDFVVKYRYIILLLVISGIIQLIIKEYKTEMIGTILFLFIGSLLVSYVAVQYHRKYNQYASHMKWWIGIYIFMILIASIP